MNAKPLPRFEPGTAPQAADFVALVDAVRALLSATGTLPPPRKTRPRRRLFTPAGTARFTLDDAGGPAALLAEYRWQVGPEVQLLSGGNLSGLGDALQDAAPTPVGLHADFAYQLQGSIEGATMRATGVSWSTAPWVEPVEDAQGALHGIPHGSTLVAAFMPAPGPKHQRQRAFSMHPMPQRPAVVWRSWEWPDLQGCAALLPAPAFSQVLTRSPGGYYSASGDFIHRSNVWYARLDAWGQLHISAGTL